MQYLNSALLGGLLAVDGEVAAIGVVFQQAGQGGEVGRAAAQRRFDPASLRQVAHAVAGADVPHERAERA